MSQDRTRQTRTIPPTSTIPMPGRLAVSYRSDALRIDIDTTLDQAPVGELVTATGVITTVRYLDRNGVLGRVMIVLADDDGDSALITLGPDVVRMIQPVLAKGTRLTVRGIVSRPHSHQPAGIDGMGVRVVS